MGRPTRHVRTRLGVERRVRCRRRAAAGGAGCAAARSERAAASSSRQRSRQPDRSDGRSCLRLIHKRRRNVWSTSNIRTHRVTKRRGQAPARQWRWPGLGVAIERGAGLCSLCSHAVRVAVCNSCFTVAPCGRQQVRALVERRLARLVHLPIDIGARGVQCAESNPRQRRRVALLRAALRALRRRAQRLARASMMRGSA